MWRIKPIDLCPDALLRCLDCYQWHKGTLKWFTNPAEAQALALRNMNRKEGLRTTKKQNNSTVWKQHLTYSHAVSK